MKVWIDADACPQPVRDIVLRAAARLKFELVFVANKMLTLPASQQITFVKVEEGPDIADEFIKQNASTEDLVISQDIPLAHSLVKSGIVVINPRGEVYTENNIGERISNRDLFQDLRDAGLVTGGPKQYGDKEKRAFASAFDRELTKLLNRRAK